EPELFASLRPQTYEGDMYARRQPVVPAAPLPAAAEPAAAGGAGASARFKDAKLADRDGAELRERLLARGAVTSFEAEKLDLGVGVASAATATKLGESFQYRIEQPVHLPRQKSALLPIVQHEVEGTRVSVYNPAVHAKYPLLGLKLKN